MSNSFNGKKLSCCFHCHSDQSVDGASTVEALVRRMVDLEFTHVTLTEHGTLGSAAAVHRIVNSKKMPLKVIHGVEGYLYWPNDPNPKKTYHITIFFKTRRAFEEYCKLTPIIYSEPRVQVKAADWKPCLTWDDFLQLANTKEIIIGTGCVGSWLNKPIADSGDIEGAKKRMALMVDAVGASNIYDEWIVDDLGYKYVKSKVAGTVDTLIQDECRPWFHSPDIGAETNRVRWEYVTKPYGVRRVASQDAHYADAADKVIQDNKRWSFGLIMPYHQHVKSTGEYAELALATQKFQEKDVEELIDNTCEFVEHFDKYEFLTQKERGFIIPKHSENPREEIYKRIAAVGNIDMNDPVYRDRIEYELSVLACNDKYDGESYMLMTSDIADMSRNNKILVNTRGCLAGDSLILTRGGYQKISAVTPGEEVVTLSGTFCKVSDRFEYGIDEELIEIKSRYGFGPLVLTKDHKVYACKRARKYQTQYMPFSMDDFGWYRADELKEGDLLFTPWPKFESRPDMMFFDLGQYITSTCAFVVTDQEIHQEIDTGGPVTVRCVSRETEISRSVVKNIKKGVTPRDKKHLQKIETYLKNHGFSLDTWRSHTTTKTKILSRFVKVDEEFCYFIGKWIGDGWLELARVEAGQGYSMGMAFSSDEISEVNRTESFLRKNGIEPCTKTHAKKKLIQVTWASPVWFNFIRNLFPDYQDSSTKSFGSLLSFSDQQLRWVIQGMYSADGSVRQDLQGESYDTTSLLLATQLKEVLLRLKQQSSVGVRLPYIRKQGGKEYLCTTSYKISSKGLDTVHQNNQKFILPEGYVSPIYELSSSSHNKVYDLCIEDEHNYLTSSGIVHNSGGGSAVAYGIGLSVTDPIKYGLQFERFLTAGRINTGSVADLDCDFSNKDGILKLMKEKYGDCMMPISIDTLLKPKMAIKDLERHFLGAVRPETERMCVAMDGIAQGVETNDWLFGYTNDEGDHVDGELDRNRTLKDYSEKNPDIWDAVLRMCGVMRQKSIHASGVIVAPEPVQNIMPVIRVGKKGEDQLVTAYGPKDVEYVGLPKFDILGVAKMAVIEECFRLINERHGVSLEWGKLPHSDDVYKSVYWTGQTSAIFQGTDGIAALCQKCHPTTIEELSNLIALYRPSCLDAPSPLPQYKNMVDYYVGVKKGEVKAEYIHPELESIYGSTAGVPLFQEQQLKLFRDFADYTYETAEGVRRSISKKDQRALAEHGGALQKKLVERGWTAEQAKTMLDVVVASAFYGFNCSHSTSYAIVSYHTAFLKHFYPLEYWCAELTVETIKGTNEDKLQQYGVELRQVIVQPDVLHSDAVNWKISGDKLVAPLLAIKGTGDVFVHHLLRVIHAESVEAMGLLKKEPKSSKTVAKKRGTQEDLFDEYD